MKLFTVVNVIVFTFLLSSFTFNKEPFYHSVEAKNGDFIHKLLSRYNLSSSECNLEKFYELNGLKPNSSLLYKKEYQLPLKVYAYNGKSIRSSIGDMDLEKALRIQQYNDDLFAKGVRSASYINSKLLWVPYHEIACDGVEHKKSGVNVVEDLSTKGSAVIELFGEKYAKLEVIDKKLSGEVYYISSGHGGPDPGAMCLECEQTMCEDEYAYDVTLRLARNLMQRGATVHVIIQDENDGIRDDKYLDCDNDEITLSGKKLPIRQLDRLKQRADAINKLYEKYKKKGVKVQKAIMIHVDSRAKDKNQDVFFYYHDENDGGKALAENVLSTFEHKYNYYRKDKEYRGYVQNRGLFMLKNVRPSSVYVELANIRNAYDHKRLIYHYNRQALANWLFEGITSLK